MALPVALRSGRSQRAARLRLRHRREHLPPVRHVRLRPAHGQRRLDAQQLQPQRLGQRLRRLHGRRLRHRLPRRPAVEPLHLLHRAGRQVGRGARLQRPQHDRRHQHHPERHPLLRLHAPDQRALRPLVAPDVGLERQLRPAGHRRRPGLRRLGPGRRHRPQHGGGRRAARHPPAVARRPPELGRPRLQPGPALHLRPHRQFRRLARPAVRRRGRPLVHVEPGRHLP